MWRSYGRRLPSFAGGSWPKVHSTATARAAQASAGIVEDNDDSRTMSTEALALKGHAVRSVNDGRSALDAVDAWRPDVVILDIGLPGMNGQRGRAACA